MTCKKQSKKSERPIASLSFAGLDGVPKMIVERQPTYQNERDLWAGKKYLAAMANQEKRIFKGLSVQLEDDKRADLTCRDEDGNCVYIQVTELVLSYRAANTPGVPETYEKEYWDCKLEESVRNKLGLYPELEQKQFILLIYSVDYSVGYCDEALARACSLLNDTEHPFDEVWYLEPGFRDEDGMNQVWPNAHAHEPMQRDEQLNTNERIAVLNAIDGSCAVLPSILVKDLTKTIEFDYMVSVITPLFNTIPITPCSELAVEYIGDTDME